RTKNLSFNASPLSSSLSGVVRVVLLVFGWYSESSESDSESEASSTVVLYDFGGAFGKLERRARVALFFRGISRVVQDICKVFARSCVLSLLVLILPRC